MLTPRESELAMLVLDGLAAGEMAERLCLSHDTLGQHVKRVYRKLGVELTRRAAATTPTLLDE